MRTHTHIHTFDTYIYIHQALSAYDVVEILQTKPPKTWRMGGGLAILKPNPEILEKIKKECES
jgi:hypothetical protein